MDNNYFNNAYNNEANSPKKAKQYIDKVQNWWNGVWQKGKKTDNVNEQYQPNYQAQNQYMEQTNPYAQQQEAQYGEQQDFGSLRRGYRSRNPQHNAPYQDPQNYDNQAYDQQANFDGQYANQYSQQNFDYNQQYNQNNYNPPFQHVENQAPLQFPTNPTQFATNNVVGFNTGEVVNEPNAIKIGVYALFESANCIDLIAQMQGSSMFFVNMENFADMDKIRSSKDIILGACYALNYTMLCIGSSNMYLICPKTVAVSMNDATRNFLESIVSRKKAKSKFSINMDDSYNSYDNGLDYEEEQPVAAPATTYGRRASFR